MPARSKQGQQDPLLDIGCTDLEPIASGGFSVVYRGRQRELDRPVAVKVLNLPVGDERGRRRFERELTLAGRLTGHPNVVSVFGSGFLWDGRGYVTMEYCPGGSLEDRLAAEGTLPARDVVSIGVKMCGVLSLAAGEGIMHRDVKPANILVTRFGEPALSDFGVAVAAGETGATTGALTPRHAAPEMLESRDDVGPAADQWSLASTLHTLLAGRPPFAGVEGEGMLTAMLRVLNDPVPTIPRADLPADLAVTLARAMAKNPGDRWPSAADFGQALQEIERSEGWPVTPLPDREVPDAHGGGGPVQPVAAAESASGLQAAGAVQTASAIQAGAGATRSWSKRDIPPPEVPEEPKPSRRGWWIGGAGVGVGLVAIAVAAVLVVSNGSTPPKPAPPVHHLQRPSASLATTARPRDVEVVNEQPTRVTLHWIDPSNGRYPYVVRWAGGIDTNTSPTEAVITGLDPSDGYCFVVSAVYGDGGQTADAPPVCIRSGKTTPPTDQAS